LFRILHLSDLHIQTTSTWARLPILTGAKQRILEQAAKENFNVIAFTGDIAFSGKREQFQIAAEWLDDLCLGTSGLNMDRKELLFVPGNHDIDRTLISATASAIEEQLLLAKEQANVARFYDDSESLQLLLRRQSAYGEFCSSFTGTLDFAEACWSRTFEYQGKRIRFDGINTSWLCRGEDDHRRLLIGQPQLSALAQKQDQADFVIALAHHPVADLMEFDERNFISHLRSSSDMFLRGHLHDPQAVYSNSQAGGYLELASGALHESYEGTNRFSVIDITDDLCTVLITTYIWLNGRWIQDRNFFETESGIGRFDITPKHWSNENNAVANIAAISQIDDGAATAPGTDSNKSEAKNTIAAFPRFEYQATKQDLAIRQADSADCILELRNNRYLRIVFDTGSKIEGFLANVVSEIKKDSGDLPVLMLPCAGVSTGRLLQDSLALAASCSVTLFAAAIRELGEAVLILSNLEEQASSETSSPSIESTVGALLDFCPALMVVRTSPLPFAEGVRFVRVGALDVADTRAYLENSPRFKGLKSVTDFTRVHRVTGGVPLYLDDVVSALEVSGLEDSLAQIDHQSSVEAEVIPEANRQLVNELSSNDAGSDLERVRRLLWTLCILERGESLATIKRLDPQSPIWPKHATYLQQRGCLEVIDATPKHYGTINSLYPTSGDKILRVPRLLRDFVLARMTHDEQVDLVRSALSLYFADDWRQGIVRMRRRVAFGSEISTHQSGNEMTILRYVVNHSSDFFDDGNTSCFSLGLSYISQLKSKGFYGEAYESAREFLGFASRQQLPNSSEELQTLRTLAGACARMIGERDACIQFVGDALPQLRRAKVKDRLADALVDIALASQGMALTTEAKTYAEEILLIVPKESSQYFQAKAILAEMEDDKGSRLRKLRALKTRSRNLGLHTVADNITLEIVKESDNTEEKLKLLADVRSRGEREYNYVRATIRRIETLLDSGRIAEVTIVDKQDLWRSYQLAYSQKLSGVFEWCHRICWRFLCETDQREHLADLFMFSSFVWRLNGDVETEKKYIASLSTMHEDTAKLGPLKRLFQYISRRQRSIEPKG
jgi:predicted MPP superfamily phosphohydrolase